MTQKISQMTQNPAPALTDQFEVNANGVTYKNTIQDILTLINASYSYIPVTTTPFQMVNYERYLANSNSLIVFNLPTTAAAGSFLEVAGEGAGGWQIAQSLGQNIITPNGTTSTGVSGSLSSLSATDRVVLVCVVTNLTWQLIDSTGTLHGI